MFMERKKVGKKTFVSLVSEFASGSVMRESCNVVRCDNVVFDE